MTPEQIAFVAAQPECAKISYFHDAFDWSVAREGEMSEPKLWYVVCSRDLSDYRGEGGDPETLRDADTIWTVSKSPDKEGWETDSGTSGYGLTRADAQELADGANDLARCDDICPHCGRPAPSGSF